MKSKIPVALIYSRLLLGFAIVILSLINIQNISIIAIAFLCTGLLTDIFDGIIARHLNVSTQKLRRMDSIVDVIFFLCFIAATFIQCSDFYETNVLKLGMLIGAESFTYVISFMKFKKEVATHSIGAKIWTIFIFITLIQVILYCQSGLIFNLCFWIGIVSRIDIIAIIFILKNWTSDVPTFLHAIKLRRGETIKRYKIFNG